MAPATFDAFLADIADCDYCKNQELCNNFVREATLLGKFLRAFTFAAEFRLDYLSIVEGVDVFRSTDLPMLVTKIEEDARSWTVNDDKATLRFFGTTLTKRGMMTIALAVFIVLEEYPKIEALMIVHPDLKKLIVDFLRNTESQKYAEGIRSLLGLPALQ
jgi:hypothetical protein